MLDIEYIRENPEKVKQNAANKGVEVDIDKLLELCDERKKLRQQWDNLQSDYKKATNLVSWIWKLDKQIEQGKKPNLSVDDAIQRLKETNRDFTPLIHYKKAAEALQKSMRGLLSGVSSLTELVSTAAFIYGSTLESEREKKKTDQMSEVLRSFNNKIHELELQVPNMADPDVPVGGGKANKVERVCYKDKCWTGEEAQKKILEWENEAKGLEVKAHWDIGDELGILDTKLAAKLAGSNFALFRGAGAKMVRSLMAFMLDTHSAKGYVEVWPPVLANREIMTGTGQLPKFEHEMYRIMKSDLYLVPTAEVPLTALHAGEILQFTDLPLGYCAYTPCFRREAGAYGRETRGLLRVHQFDKVEILKVTTPEQSAEELEKLLADAEGIIQKLGLRYRVQLLSTGEMTFASERTYDIEIWSPGVKRWLEVSSVSGFGDFQARRLNVRYRDKNRKVHFCYTMNGSGVAFARLIACLLETYQQADGSVAIPKALVSYFGSDKIERP